LTSTINYQCYNWKDFIAEKIRPCPGIRDWHRVRIPQEGDHILTSTGFEGPLTPSKILIYEFSPELKPPYIISEGLSDSPLNEFSFFEDFMSEGDKKSISGSY